jgi:hypothetical protein
MTIVDLSAPIGKDPSSPPSVNEPIEIKEYHKESGFWMVSEITMLLHSGSDVDFTNTMWRMEGRPRRSSSSDRLGIQRSTRDSINLLSAN